MSAPLPYEKSLGIESWKEKKPLTQPWAAAKHKDDAERIFDEEVALFSSECYSSYTIAEKRGYFLNLAYLAFPAELRETVIPEIDAIRESLVHHFELGLERVVTVRPGH